jgi:hypothetical protein
MESSQILGAPNLASNGQTSPAGQENAAPAPSRALSPRHFSSVFSKALEQEAQPSSGPARKPAQNQSSSLNVFPSAEPAASVTRPVSLMEMLALAEAQATGSDSEPETGNAPADSSTLLNADGQLAAGTGLSPAMPGYLFEMPDARLAPGVSNQSALPATKAKSGAPNGNSQADAEAAADSGRSLATALAAQASGFGLLASLSLPDVTLREVSRDVEEEPASGALARKASAASDATGVESGRVSLPLASGIAGPSSAPFSANRAELAFSARLVSLNPAEPGQSGGIATGGATSVTPVSLTSAGESYAAIPPRSTTDQKTQSHSGGAQESDDTETASSDSAAESATPARPASSQQNDHTSTARPLQPDATADSIQPNGGAASSQNSAAPYAQAIELQSGGGGQHASGSPAAGAEMRPGTAAEPTQLESAKPEPAARDIKLQVSEEGQRAEVRLVERGGVVQMSVRTPDAKLAGTLREDLPSLSAKLENAGFRAEVWRPAAAAGPGSRHLSESLNGQNSQQDDSGRRRQDTREDRETLQPRQPKVKPTDSAGKQTEKDFAWYISNLR